MSASEDPWARASSCVGGLAHELSALLERARTAEEVGELLGAAHQLCVAPLTDHTPPGGPKPAALSDWRWAAAHDAALSSGRRSLAELFCWRELRTFIDTLLTGGLAGTPLCCAAWPGATQPVGGTLPLRAVVACDWLPCLAPGQQERLFFSFFASAPAHMALLGLHE